jgi:hypothetical protein
MESEKSQQKKINIGQYPQDWETPKTKKSFFSPNGQSPAKDIAKKIGAAAISVGDKFAHFFKGVGRGIKEGAFFVAVKPEELRLGQLGALGGSGPSLGQHLGGIDIRVTGEAKGVAKGFARAGGVLGGVFGAAIGTGLAVFTGLYSLAAAAKQGLVALKPENRQERVRDHIKALVNKDSFDPKIILENKKHFAKLGELVKDDEGQKKKLDFLKAAMLLQKKLCTKPKNAKGWNKDLLSNEEKTMLQSFKNIWLPTNQNMVTSEQKEILVSGIGNVIANRKEINEFFESALKTVAKDLFDSLNKPSVNEK